jgi:hypothetical protein
MSRLTFIPDVLRTEAQFRLLFAGQVLSLIGDRVMLVALPFAVHLWEVSLQEHVPGQALSRVSSFDYLAATALMPVGTAVAGPIAAASGSGRRCWA